MKIIHEGARRFFPWVRIASSAPSAMSLLKRNSLLAESALEAMRTHGFSEKG